MMKSLALIIRSAVFLVCFSVSAFATPARFWFSLSASDPGDPLGAVSTDFFVRTSPAIAIWAQPGRDDLSGTLKVLENMSLNLVLSEDSSDATAIEFVDDSITVFNEPLPSGIPAMPTQRRFEFVNDASTGLVVNQECEDNTVAQGVCGLQGVTINIDHSGLFTGVGGEVCDPNDSHCVMLPSSEPAWLVGVVKIRPLVDGATANFRLQIGGNGINHLGESSSKTQVFLGNDNTPIYQAGKDRNTNLVGGQYDAPHLVARIIEPDPDFNGDGTVDVLDLEKWRIDFGAGDGSDADFDGDSDGVDMLFWQRFFEGLPGLSGLSIPEPTCGMLLGLLFLLKVTRCRLRFG